MTRVSIDAITNRGGLVRTRLTNGRTWLVAACWLWSAFTLSAQENVHADRTLRLRVGFGVGVMSTGDQGGDPPATIGVMLAVEREMSPWVVLRAGVETRRTLGVGDQVSVCGLLPDGSCRPGPVFPLTTISPFLTVVSPPLRATPLSVGVGVGVSYSRGATRRSGNAVPRLKHQAEPFGEAGIELRLARSPSLPTLRLRRQQFVGALMSMEGSTSLDLLLRVR